MKFLAVFVVAFACANADVNELRNTQPQTISQNLEIAPDGSEFGYNWETDNKIKVIVQGKVNNLNGESPALEETGSVSYYGNDGVPVDWTFTAGVNGYEPKGALLPTPPPTPELILRLLKFLEGKPVPKQ